MAGPRVINEDEFEDLVEKLYPHYKLSKERARFYFNEKRLAMNAPNQYNEEQLNGMNHPLVNS